MPRADLQPDLFAEPAPQALPEGVFLRTGLFGSDFQSRLVAAVEEIARQAPFRQPRVRGKGQFSARITNAGTAGWWSDEKGYRYTATQPGTALPWPAFPESFVEAVGLAVAGTQWVGFHPDACLINFYDPEAKMGLHQDRDERDLAQPIITVSLGATADFLIGGSQRADRARAIRVASGDAMIMGPPGRMLFHGVRRIHAGTSPIAGLEGRYSLTFRKAL